jgi:hypothetical protein
MIDCHVTIVGDDVDTFEQKVRGYCQQYSSDLHEPLPECFCFNSLYPIPEKVLARKRCSDPSWEEQHWGCNGAWYSTLDEKTPENLIYFFQTKSVPAKWFRKVSRDYPDLVFHLDFEEEETFEKGSLIFENGLVIDTTENSIGSS